MSGTFTMKDGLISGNKALTGSGNGGGGIFNNGVVMLEGGEVSGNSAFFDGEHTGYLSYGEGSSTNPNPSFPLRERDFCAIPLCTAAEFMARPRRLR